MGIDFKIKNLIAIPIALSLAINSGELLIYLDSGINLFSTPRDTSISLIVYRLISVFLYCFLVLYVNVYKTDYWLQKLKIKYTLFGKTVINVLLYLATFIPFVYIQDKFILNLHEKEDNGLAFVWIILMLICVLSASIIKLKAKINVTLTGQPQFVRYSQEDLSFRHDMEGLDQNYLTSLLLPRNKVLEPVKINEFAIFFIDEGVVKGKTFSSKVYYIDKNILELEKKLDPDVFFRTNRQCMINRDAVQHIEPDSYGKVTLALNVEHEEIVISKLKSKQFKDWLVGHSV